MLSDQSILKAVREQRLIISPWNAEMVQPASIDVRLDRYFRVFRNDIHPVIDPAVEQSALTELLEIVDGEYFVLRPGEFVLASTLETVSLADDLAARLEGKSSLGRLGLITHSTAGFIDPGFSGQVTLELSNLSGKPIRLWPGMKIGQICLFQLTSEADRPYGHYANGSRYQHQRGPMPSRSWVNWKTWPTQ